MTNTIVLLSFLLQTNWQDTTVMNGGMQIQVGRRQTNYVMDWRAPNASGNFATPIIWPCQVIGWHSASVYPILTSQPFFGPYNLVREVPGARTLIFSNIGVWPRDYGIITNLTFPQTTNRSRDYIIPLPGGDSNLNP